MNEKLGRVFRALQNRCGVTDTSYKYFVFRQMTSSLLRRSMISGKHLVNLQGSENIKLEIRKRRGIVDGASIDKRQ